MPSNQLKNQHLLWRAAFGPMTENANQLEKVSPYNLWKLLKDTSAKKPDYIDVASNPIDGLVKGIQDDATTEKERQELAKARRRQSAQDLKSLDLSWLNKMINSEAQLREKMSLFWHAGS